MNNKEEKASASSDVINNLSQFKKTKNPPQNIDFNLKKETIETNISLFYFDKENKSKDKFDYKDTDLYNILIQFRNKNNLKIKKYRLKELQGRIHEIQDHLLKSPDNLKSLPLEERDIILAWADEIRASAGDVISGDNAPSSDLSTSDDAGLPSMRWPADKLPKENAEAFFRRVWFDCAVTHGTLTRQRLSEIEPDFMNTLGSTFSKNGGPPDDLAKWWAVREKTGPKPNKNNNLLELHGIKKPKDAFNIHTLTKKEQKRLYEAARYREKQALKQ